jgi:hypothetical protein
MLASHGNAGDGMLGFRCQRSIRQGTWRSFISMIGVPGLITDRECYYSAQTFGSRPYLAGRAIIAAPGMVQVGAVITPANLRATVAAMQVTLTRTAGAADNEGAANVGTSCQHQADVLTGPPCKSWGTSGLKLDPWPGTG